MTFIKINNTIQDYKKYTKETLLLKNYLKIKLKEILKEQDFSLIALESGTYDEVVLVFYNKHKDLQLTMSVFKKGKEVFV